MDRVNQNFKWVIRLIIVFFIVGFLSWELIDLSYKEKQGKTENKHGIAEEITCESTNVNGKIKGIVRNNTKKNIEYVNVKIEFYSKYNVKMGEEFLELFDFEPNEIKDFEKDYYYTDVESYKVITSKEKPEENQEEGLKLGLPMTKENIAIYALIAVLLFY